jgi:hypothetical protein
MKILSFLFFLAAAPFFIGFSPISNLKSEEPSSVISDEWLPLSEALSQIQGEISERKPKRKLENFNYMVDAALMKKLTGKIPFSIVENSTYKSFEKTILDAGGILIQNRNINFFLAEENDRDLFLKPFLTEPETASKNLNLYLKSGRRGFFLNGRCVHGMGDLGAGFETDLPSHLIYCLNDIPPFQCIQGIARCLRSNFYFFGSFVFFSKENKNIYNYFPLKNEFFQKENFENFKFLVGNLNSENFDIREDSEKILLKYGLPVIPVLDHILRQEISENQKQAIQKIISLSIENPLVSWDDIFPRNLMADRLDEQLIFNEEALFYGHTVKYCFKKILPDFEKNGSVFVFDEEVAKRKIFLNPKGLSLGKAFSWVLFLGKAHLERKNNSILVLPRKEEILLENK